MNIKLGPTGAYQERQRDEKIRKAYGIDDPNTTYKIDHWATGLLNFIWEKIIRKIWRWGWRGLFTVLAIIGFIALIHPPIQKEIISVIGEALTSIWEGIKSVTESIFGGK